MNDYASKPFDPDDPHSKISRYMSTGPKLKSITTKSLLAKLNVFADGNPDFRRELAELIIKNIQELQATVTRIGDKGGLEQFLQVAHKIKTSLKILGDDEFHEIIELIKTEFEKGNSRKVLEHIKSFNAIGAKLTNDLKEVIETEA
jgi:HPt (histidine-containing phosphotransfer) domain-containing protein